MGKKNRILFDTENNKAIIAVSATGPLFSIVAVFTKRKVSKVVPCF